MSAVPRTDAAGWSFSAGSGAPLAPPSQAAQARARALFAAPDTPVASLAQSLVGTGMLLVRALAAARAAALLAVCCARMRTDCGLADSASACAAAAAAAALQLHPQQGLVPVFGAQAPRTRGREEDEPAQGMRMRDLGTPSARARLPALVRVGCLRANARRAAALTHATPRRRRRQAAEHGGGVMGCASARRVRPNSAAARLLPSLPSATHARGSLTGLARTACVHGCGRGVAAASAAQQRRAPRDAPSNERCRASLRARRTVTTDSTTPRCLPWGLRMRTSAHARSRGRVSTRARALRHLTTLRASSASTAAACTQQP
jgi:hypothetical protein